MAYTKVADVIEPQIFVPYMIQKTTETNAFLASGIATPDENIVIDRGGRTVNLPFWKDLGGTNEVLSDSAALTVNKVDAFADIAAIHARGVAYGFNNLAGLIAGDDPMRVIADKLAGRWSKDIEKVLRSAIANWEQKNDRKAENGELYISRIFVDEGATLKRMRPAPQGRGYRIRKRSNHITIFVDAKTNEEK